MPLQEVKNIIRLAGPVMLARAGAIIIVTVDTAMCGYASVEDLAYYGIANALHLAPLFWGIGFLVGIVVYTATCAGARRFKLCGEIWKVGLIHSVAIGILIALLLQFGEFVLLLTGQSEQLAHGGGNVLIMHSIGIIAVLAMIATSMFLEGLQKPLPGLFTMIAINFLNVFLNWVLIFGNLGMPELGAEGAALSTAIIRWVGFLALLLYVLFCVDNVKYGIRTKLRTSFAISRKLRRLGYPMGIAHGVESVSFAVLTIFAGLMGIIQTAIWSIGMNLITIAFMLALGFATAASVRVAYNAGGGSLRNAAQSGWTATVLALATLTILGAVYLTFPEFISRIYNQDPEVLVLAVPLIVFTAAALVPYGLQVVLVGVLRGLQDMWMIALTQLVSFVLVMLPLGYIIGIMNDGTPIDLMAATLVGSIIAVAMLSFRFRHLSRN